MPQSQQRRREFWRELIAQQEQSGVSVRTLCEQRGVSEQSFYQWRKRLALPLPMKFALVEAGRSGAGTACIELMLTSGERLRIAPGVDSVTLRMVLGILREPR